MRGGFDARRCWGRSALPCAALRPLRVGGGRVRCCACGRMCLARCRWAAVMNSYCVGWSNGGAIRGQFSGLLRSLFGRLRCIRWWSTRPVLGTGRSVLSSGRTPRSRGHRVRASGKSEPSAWQRASRDGPIASHIAGVRSESGGCGVLFASVAFEQRQQFG